MTQDKRQVFDGFATRLKKQYEIEGKPKTDREIRKECEAIAHKAEIKHKEAKK